MKKKVKFDWKIGLVGLIGLFLFGVMLPINYSYNSQIKALQADIRNINADNVIYQTDTWISRAKYCSVYDLYEAPLSEVIDAMLNYLDVEIVPSRTVEYTKIKPLRLEKRK